MPAFGIGKGERSKLQPTLSPGPGRYFDDSKESASKTVKPHYQTSKKCQPQSSTALLAPGPGTYNLPSCIPELKKKMEAT
jgi:hypothetical protein